jgi:hypothetical protein
VVLVKVKDAGGSQAGVEVDALILGAHLSQPALRRLGERRLVELQEQRDDAAAHGVGGSDEFAEAFV